MPWAQQRARFECWRRVTRAAVVVAGAALLAACAGNGVGLDANGQPLSSAGSEPLSADFESIQDNVFTPICTRCHSGANAPEGLQLDAAHSYGLLVGVYSVEQPSIQRVKAGDPDHSYLVMKLEGSSGISGGQMPLGGPYLPQSTIDFIRQWITNDAPPAAAATTQQALRPEAFAVTGTAPPQGAVSAPIDTIVVTFNTEPSLPALAAGSSLERVDAAGSAMPLQFTRAAGNPATVLLRLPTPLPLGHYRLQLAGGDAAPVTSVTGQPLPAAFALSFTVDINP